MMILCHLFNIYNVLLLLVFFNYIPDVLFISILFELRI